MYLYKHHLLLTSWWFIPQGEYATITFVIWMITTPYSMELHPPEVEKWQLCLNIVVTLPPKPPQLNCIYHYLDIKIFPKFFFCKLTCIYLEKFFMQNWETSISCFFKCFEISVMLLMYAAEKIALRNVEGILSVSSATLTLNTWLFGQELQLIK